MASGSITVKLRPLRIAFVVEAYDRDAIYEAIRINSLLWGGHFNPIIPYSRRMPKWFPKNSRPSSARDLFQSYFDLYDPDFVVRVGRAADGSSISLPAGKELKVGDILGGLSDDFTPGYGVGIFEILDYLLHEELRFVRRDDLSFRFPKIENDLFLASVFGIFPKEVPQSIAERFTTASIVVEKPCDLSNYGDFLSPSNLFTRRICALDLKSHVRAWWSGTYAFLMDANSLADIILYWNFRSLGWRILPVPRQTAMSTPVRNLLSTYVEANYWPRRGNPSLYNYTTLLKSPSIPESEAVELGKSLQLQPVPPGQHFKFSFCMWLPRFWEEWARIRDGADRGSVESKQHRAELQTTNDRFQVDPLLPAFAAEFGGHGTPRCANELELRVYDDKLTFAEVIPAGGAKVAHATRMWGLGNVRCSTDGLIYFPTMSRWTERFPIPRADELFSAWFAERGWKVETSDKGHVTKQLLQQLGGLWHTGWLIEEPVFKLLMQISNSRPIDAASFHALLQRALRGKPRRQVNALMKWLVESNIVRLGIEVVCPKCRQRSWFSLAEADYEVECRQCIELFRLPTDSLKDMPWSYRGFGAFGVPRQTQGGLTVILLLRLFSLGMRDNITPLLSFNAFKDGGSTEIDLALLTRRMRHGLYQQDTLFAECKTYNELTREDVTRMERFARNFPGAVVILAVLRRELSPREKKLLRPFANRGRRLWKATRPYNAVVVLTGNELFASHDPHTTWRELAGKFAKHSERFSYENDLVGLADSTQQLYLDLEPWNRQPR